MGLCAVAQSYTGHQKLVCSTCGPIVFEEDIGLYLGQMEDASSLVPELYAQVVARMFILQYMSYFTPCSRVPIEIIYDNMGANSLAVSAKASLSQPDLASLCKILDIVVTKLYPYISYYIYALFF